MAKQVSVLRKRERRLERASLPIARQFVTHRTGFFGKNVHQMGENSHQEMILGKIAHRDAAPMQGMVWSRDGVLWKPGPTAGGQVVRAVFGTQLSQVQSTPLPASRSAATTERFQTILMSALLGSGFSSTRRCKERHHGLKAVSHPQTRRKRNGPEPEKVIPPRL